MAQWLLNRLFDAKSQPTPRFAFQGSINWMRALAIMVGGGRFDANLIRTHYQGVQRRSPNPDADTLAFENMLMAYHHQSSLDIISKQPANSYDICRLAIIGWYYSVYFSGSAMIAATSGSVQETHALTAKVWHEDIVKVGLAMQPFSLHLKTLVSKNADAEVATYRGTNSYDLSHNPSSDDQAWGGLCSYLNGTKEFEQWRVEKRLKDSSAFKALNVQNFRTKAARDLRDSQFAKNGVNFLTKAFRYRGKANYRDSIFLSYGDNNSARMATYVSDLTVVSFAFQRMAAAYISRRVEKDTWQKFVDDLDANSRLTLRPDYLIV